MHIVQNLSAPKTSKKIYRSVLLRESYREGGKVKKRTIANLSRCTAGEIAAIKLALSHKEDLTVLGSLKESVQLQEGLSVGAVWAVYEVGKRLGLEKALGTDVEGKRAFWQVIARVIDQGSRLSAVRLAQTHAACDILGMRRGFDENDLYDNLGWLADHQEEIEKGLFFLRRSETKRPLFFYDVTSSYLEGEKNYFGDYGYPRDGKKGKQQIVIGLLCDEDGEPVSTEVFSGNTQDTRTFASQVRKVAERLGCQEVTFVGDRGMIKTTQIENLPEGFHYITAITKPQIEKLMNRGVIQFGLFDARVCEVEESGIRYILRRNPARAQEMEKSRLSKRRALEELVSERNLYLSEHSRAKVATALGRVESKMKLLRLEKWLSVKIEDRRLRLEQDDAVLKEESLWDGCYVIKTDLAKSVADKQLIHDRYKDLAEIERAFRDCKTAMLDVRPVFVRSEKSTRGHVFVVMLGYMIIRKLREAWARLDMTVQEGLKQLSTLCSMEIKVKDHGCCLKIPRPREKSQELLKELDVRLPTALPHREIRVVTRKKLPEQRKIP
jgi:transposase